MAELVVLVIIAVFFGWIAWIVWGVKQTLDKVMLDEAWRTVLDDPHYKERRHLEERKHAKAKARFNAPHSVTPAQFPSHHYARARWH